MALVKLSGLFSFRFLSQMLIFYNKQRVCKVCYYVALDRIL